MLRVALMICLASFATSSSAQSVNRDCNQLATERAKLEQWISFDKKQITAAARTRPAEEMSNWSELTDAARQQLFRSGVTMVLSFAVDRVADHVADIRLGDDAYLSALTIVNRLRAQGVTNEEVLGGVRSIGRLMSRSDPSDISSFVQAAHKTFETLELKDASRASALEFTALLLETSLVDPRARAIPPITKFAVATGYAHVSNLLGSELTSSLTRLAEQQLRDLRLLGERLRSNVQKLKLVRNQIAKQCLADLEGNWLLTCPGTRNLMIIKRSGFDRFSIHIPEDPAMDRFYSPVTLDSFGGYSVKTFFPQGDYSPKSQMCQNITGKIILIDKHSFELSQTLTPIPGNCPGEGGGSEQCTAVRQIEKQ
jgi:hypothetical protein